MAATHFSGPLIVNGVYNQANVVKSVTAGATLTAADNGKIIVLGDAAPGNVTLPAVTTSGFRVRIVNGATTTTSGAVVSAEGDNISGVLTVNGALVAAVAEDQINFIQSASVAGDWIEVISDGTQWLVSGQGSAAGSITATDPA